MHCNKEELQKLIKQFDLKNLTPLGLETGGGFDFFTAFLGRQKVFIKCGPDAQHEYNSTKILYDLNQENFVKPLAKSQNFAIFEYVGGGQTLNTYLKSAEADKNKKIIAGLENIAKTLISANITHKDISYVNLMITNDGTAKLIDLQHARALPSSEQVAKMSYLCKNNGYIDDMESLNEKIKRLGGTSKFISENIGIYRLPKGAKDRVKNSLCYKLGLAITQYSKSFLGYLKMPYVLWGIKNEHKNIKKNRKKLPKLEYYGDYPQSLNCKEHASYKLGLALIKGYKTWYKGGLIRFYFQAKQIQKKHKKVLIKM